MKVYRQITSWILLAVLALSIIPLESFHHHEEHSLACTESGSHIEEKAFKCELADFVLPIFTETNNRIILKNFIVENDYSVESFNLEKDLRLTNLKLRGPPLVSFLS